MPSRPGRKPDGGATDQQKQTQKQTAAELSDRAAESVDRRYDATKELHHESGGSGGPGGSGESDESGREAPDED
jgi:hypothetical protein